MTTVFNAYSTPFGRTWILLGGLVLGLGYFPMLNAPFDFIDDGNLVYPAPEGTTPTQHADRWWDKVQANVEHLGPFRPALWVHWELTANVVGADPLAWRSLRLLWCAFAASMFLWLLKELKIHPVAALLVAAAAFWNPYRNEIWTSLTLAEGVAMPYAFLALVAARKAASSTAPWKWDFAALFGLLMALGCKNVFVAIVPAMVVLRVLPDNVSFKDVWKGRGLRAGLYLLPLALPLAHFVYFQQHWQPGHYETPGPSWGQALRIGSWMKGAAGLDFLGLGILGVAGTVAWTTKRAAFADHRAALLAGGLLLAFGVAVYVPLQIMAMRYTMPAVWGFDLLLAILLTHFLRVPAVVPRRVGLAALGLGLAVMTVANVGRQEKVSARSRVLWNALEHVEREASPNARVAWISGPSPGLNAEEGIHFHWHLLHRGRGDVHVALFDGNGQPIDRVEVPLLDREPEFRIALEPADGPWDAGPKFGSSYWLGRKQYSCQVQTARRPSTSPSVLDPWTTAFMKAGFNNPAADANELQMLTNGRGTAGSPATAELKPKSP